jgi:hypothetical protein
VCGARLASQRGQRPRNPARLARAGDPLGLRLERAPARGEPFEQAAVPFPVGAPYEDFPEAKTDDLRGRVAEQPLGGAVEALNATFGVRDDDERTGAVDDRGIEAALFLELRIGAADVELLHYLVSKGFEGVMLDRG